MRKLARVLRRAPGWQDISIRIVGRGPLYERASHVESVLRPLQYTRLKSIKMVHFRKTKAIRHLFKLIMSNKRVVDVGLMFDELWTYMRNLVDVKESDLDETEEKLVEDISDKRFDCQYARDDRNIKQFRAAREALLEMTACYILYKQQKVFKHDLHNWNSTPKLGPYQPEPDLCLC